MRLGVQPPHTSPSLGTWNLVRSVTGDYVGYRLPERAPDRRTDLRAHRRPMRARPRTSARPAPSAAQSGGVRASGGTEPGAQKGVCIVPESSFFRAFLVRGEQFGVRNYQKGLIREAVQGDNSWKNWEQLVGGVISGIQVGDPRRRLEGPGSEGA